MSLGRGDLVLRNFHINLDGEKRDPSSARPVRLRACLCQDNGV